MKVWKTNYSKIAKIWLVKPSVLNFKIVYLIQFLTDLNNIDVKI